MEFGISTFGEVAPDSVPGGAVNAHARMQELLTEAMQADAAGLDVFAVGEHHRPDFIVSAPEVVLAAIASVTKKIRLSSSVTVLSSSDPVRVFQNFATLDLISSGRAEIMAGRGSFIESFPLFGQDLKDYDALFVEKLNLLLQISASEVISWNGKFRPAISQRGVYPRPLQPSLPVWIAVGGTPESAIRAGTLNLPMTVAILGGQPENYVPFVTLYREAATGAGHDAMKLPLAINSQFHVNESSKKAADEFYPSYEKLMNRVGKERGWSPMTRSHFEDLRSPRGPLFVGSVDEIVNKIILQKKIFNNSRFLGQIVKGQGDHGPVLHAIELLGNEVAPRVREKLSSNSE